MRVIKPSARRSGAALVEAAIVVPVALFLLYVVFCGTIMVLTVNEVDTAAREGARWASVRGWSYNFYTKKPSATADDIATYTKTQRVTIDDARMTVNVSWDGSNRAGNYVIVEVRYQWDGLGPFPAQEIVAKSVELVTY